MVSIERWELAQKEERKHHTFSYDEGVKHYKRSYDNYFKYLGIGYNHQGKTIIEIGCADFPALEHCIVGCGIVVEPMPSDILHDICCKNGFQLIQSAVEDIELPKCDEIWILNVLQHVKDPDLFIDKCKASANVIRFFEPINYPEDTCHPHVLTETDFKRWFGDFNIYRDKVAGFHQWECAYGNYDNI